MSGVDFQRFSRGAAVSAKTAGCIPYFYAGERAQKPAAEQVAVLARRPEEPAL